MCPHAGKKGPVASGLYGTVTTYCVLCAWCKYTDRPSVDINIRQILPYYCTLDMNNVWDDYDKNKEKHEEKIESADMSYPLFIMDNNQIFDGCHRLIKAHRNGQTTVKVIILNRFDIDQCRYWS